MDRHSFRKIKATPAMIEAAKSLKTGEILVVYQDFRRIRMETELNGPYVWRNGRWRLMECLSS